MLISLNGMEWITRSHLLLTLWFLFCIIDWVEKAESSSCSRKYSLWSLIVNLVGSVHRVGTRLLYDFINDTVQLLTSNLIHINNTYTHSLGSTSIFSLEWFRFSLMKKATMWFVLIEWLIFSNCRFSLTKTIPSPNNVVCWVKYRVKKRLCETSIPC